MVQETRTRKKKMNSKKEDEHVSSFVKSHLSFPMLKEKNFVNVLNLVSKVVTKQIFSLRRLNMSQKLVKVSQTLEIFGKFARKFTVLNYEHVHCVHVPRCVDKAKRGVVKKIEVTKNDSRFNEFLRRRRS